ncbi:MAG: SDR family oxidoreductase [Candidatus Hydrogenedentes bacterium]|nr:SDR family oxidoreductase [Candidatus Hydrogenedentota bacterium]
MHFLLLGATGATGRLLAADLLDRGHEVRAVIRPASTLPPSLAQHDRLTLTPANLLDLSDTDLANLIRGCDGVACCLGHNMTLKGIFGPPRRLVTDATRRVCDAIQDNAPARPTRFVLMNTAGNSNRDLDEPLSFGHACIISLLRHLIPPHADNECAADYLRTEIGQDHPHIQWAAVRPDSLFDSNAVSPYTAHPSPTRSVFFDPGKTSRINVAHFMALLLCEEEPWRRWRGHMPVIYNAVADATPAA